ncbi:protein-lysine N-methyltransferase SMYD4 [Microcaecilia unicolor]|uniref:Protein-lysine N-methyltransferase SMYD4 n=1 Tax=Microcaecilia unicolor TaxID=1415580 RepID=A0A6P7WUG5_9AMPH|nr:SET and MYND domain-containing protein 4 [Microcaecilia unicolor]XP_030041499.1 SET and MYND domain-containing protein 4 [Microcaecilia unicolor]
MELPIQEWRAHVHQKWESLTSSAFRENFSASSDLSQKFQACAAQLQPEDEKILQKLSQDKLVRKDPEAAAFYKQEGNKRFQGKKYASAAVLYSKALSHATTGSEEIAVCFANRSAALFHLGQYQVCLEDIERALDSGYPEQLVYKVLLRRAECLLQLQRPQEAAQVLRELEEKLASQHSLSSNKCQAVLVHIGNLKALETKHQSSRVTKHNPGYPIQDLVLCSQNPRICTASSAISLCLSSAKGRHLVAAEDISPGEMLVKEEAFVSVVVPEERPLPAYNVERDWDTEVGNEERHCHLCLVQAIAPVPCQGCSYAIYCSYKCKDKAWQDYHWAECVLGSVLLTLGVFANLALRATLVAGFTQVSSLVQEYHRDPKETERRNLVEIWETLHSSEDHPGKTEGHIPGCDSDGVYRSSYRAIFSLQPHSEHQTPEHHFLCGFTAAAICRKLQEAGLEAAVQGQKVPAEQCNAATTDEWSAELSDLGVAMLRHMLQLQCNTQGVYIIRATGIGCHVVESREQVRVASALFPVLSLMNHSCDPNISVSFQGRTAVVRAVKPIKETQEVSHCYGPHFSRMRVEERLQLLRSQYFFDCQCRACLEQQESEVKCSLPFCCVHCRAPLQGKDVLHCTCAACRFTTDRSHLMFRLQDIRLRVSRAQELLTAGNTEQAILQLEDCRGEGRSFLSPEHTVLAHIEDCLAQAHAACANWSAAAKHLQCSIQSVEALHGSSSVELGHELFKLAQIFFNGCFLTDAVRTIVRAEHILVLHYGPQHEMVQELQEMKACLAELPGVKAVLKGDVS